VTTVRATRAYIAGLGTRRAAIAVLLRVRSHARGRRPPRSCSSARCCSCMSSSSASPYADVQSYRTTISRYDTEVDLHRRTRDEYTDLRSHCRRDGSRDRCTARRPAANRRSHRPPLREAGARSAFARQGSGAHARSDRPGLWGACRLESGSAGSYARQAQLRLIGGRQALAVFVSGHGIEVAEREPVAAHCGWGASSARQVRLAGSPGPSGWLARSPPRGVGLSGLWPPRSWRRAHADHRQQHPRLL
jgi:hypothetical protein